MARLVTDRRMLLSAAVIGTLAAVALWPKPVANLPPEPTELVGGAQAIEAGFGVGDGGM